MNKPIAWLVLAGLLMSPLILQAGPYDTGAGQGYSSCAGSDIVFRGTVFRFCRTEGGAFVEQQFLGSPLWGVLLAPFAAWG